MNAWILAFLIHGQWTPVGDPVPMETCVSLMKMAKVPARCQRIDNPNVILVKKGAPT